MGEIIVPYSLFLLKLLTLVVAIVFVVGVVAVKAKKSDNDGKVELTNLSEKFEMQKDEWYSELLDEKEYKAFVKKNEKLKNENKKPRLFVLNFDGDDQASANSCLKEEITAVLMIANASDEVLLKLESPGGTVVDYGLASSQLQRLRDKGIPLTVVVDRLAASGGYMMACIANRIIAAPFGLVGSIGVVAEFPNFHRLLKKHDIDMEVMTAGESKRTITLFGEMTDEGKAKFQKQLEETHELFKNLVHTYRPQLDIAKVATGETWYGSQALELGLIDDISTSDDFILKALQDKEVFELTYKEKKTLGDKFNVQFSKMVDNVIQKLINRRDKMM